MHNLLKDQWVTVRMTAHEYREYYEWKKKQEEENPLVVFNNSPSKKDLQLGK